MILRDRPQITEADRVRRSAQNVNSSAFVVGRLDSWLGALHAYYVAATAAGVPCSGTVRVSSDLAVKICPGTDVNSPDVFFVGCRVFYSSLRLVCDKTLPADTAVFD